MNKIHKPLIMIVDDIEENLQLLATHLFQHGYEVALAESGFSALELLQEVQPDLILLDIMMPGMDGVETCQQIKSNDTYKDIPIIFLTAKTDEDSVLNAFDVGAVDYLTKPVRIQELLVRVDTQIMLKKTMQQVNDYNNRLRNLLNDRAEFMGIAAHDMKNPLHSIITYTDLLISSFSNAKMETETALEKLNVIKNSATFMLDSINELLNHDILEAGFREIKLGMYSPQKIIDTIIINNLVWADSKSIKIKYLKYPDFKILMDEDTARDIFQNIISNAIKYSNPNSTVWIALSRIIIDEYHYIRFSVRDEGLGINENDKIKLFKKMQKLSAKPTGGEGSTGMGLYIVKKLTELYGGKIDVNTKLEKGTEFIIDFPIQEFSSLNYLKFYDDIDFNKDFTLFDTADHTTKKKWNYLEDIVLELDVIDKSIVRLQNEKLSDFYYYIRKTNVINDIRKFAAEIRNFGEEINSNVFLEYGDELNKLAITFDIENLPSLLDIFPQLLNTAIKK